jgi:hypothetical protein
MDIGMLLIRKIAFVAGLAIVVMTVSSAMRTFVVPRGENVFLTRLVFQSLRRLFSLRLHWANSYAIQDRVMAYFAPTGLLLLPLVWLLSITIGYMAMFWALGVQPWFEAFVLSGSSLLTLGFAPVDGMAQTILAFSEATLGLGLVALLIAYLPTFYSAFSRREAAVQMLEVRAGAPPSAVTMIERFRRIQGLDRLSEQWQMWEIWFTELEETHTSFSPLVFFRSPRPDQSWVTAAGAVLDAAALTASTLDLPRDPQAELCIRAGYLALRGIARFFGIPFDPKPAPTDPISITQAEFEAVYEELAAIEVPLKPDRAQAWRDFAGWRVNYDTVLITLAGMTMAPYAPWSSDRAVPFRPKLFRHND